MGRPESPNRPRRLEFVREDNEGETPTNPDFERFSDEMQELSFNVDPNIFNRSKLGDDDIQGFNRGEEDDSFSVQYYLQRWLRDEIISDPSSETYLAFKSTDSGDTGVTVTIRNEDNTVIDETDTDGGDATNLVSTSKEFTDIGKVEIASSLTGDLEIYVNSGGQGTPSQGNQLGTVSSGTTSQLAVVPQDASYDAVVSDVDNAIPNTHSIVERSTRSSGGVAGGGIRTYVVAKGCKPGSVTFDGTLEGGEPLPVNIDYTAEKIRMYKIDQPDSITKLTIYSTDSADQNIDVTIEEEGGGTSETISTDGTDGTTKVTGSVDFDSIDAVELASEAQGDIKVENSNGDVLTTIYGKDEYGGQEGDLGVPAVGGSGNHASAINNSFVEFSGTAVERPNNTVLAETITSFTLTVERSLQTDPRGNGIRRRITATERVASIDSTVFEESGRYNVLREKSSVNQADTYWKMTIEDESHNIMLPRSVMNDSGDMSEAPQEGTISIDTTITGTGVVFDA